MDCQSLRAMNPSEFLFEDVYGNAPQFLEQLKLQYVNEALSFDKHIMDCIEQSLESMGNNEASSGATASRSMLISRYREALTIADPNKSRTEINALLARAANTNVEEMLLLEAKRVTLNFEEVRRRLRQGLLKRSAPMNSKFK